MIQQKLTNREIIDRGKQIYHDKLKFDAERDHLGEFIVVDVQSGDYEIAKNDAEASHNMLQRRPGAVLYGVRIGDNVAYRFGAAKSLGYQ